jgi:hypothetical protein
MLVFIVVPLTAVAASAASGSDDRGYGGHGHDGFGHGGYGGWGGPYGYYPPAPYGMSDDSDVICGPYGCAWNSALNYLPQVVIAEEAG